MRASHFEVLSPVEIESIHAASMTVLSEVGVLVDYGKARELFRQAGAKVDEEKCVVYLPESIVRWVLEQAPASFTLHGRDANFSMQVGQSETRFAGLETLSLSMQQHCQSAAEIARFLEAHPKVERIFYPGLESHPQNEIAACQMKAPGGMLGFRLKGGLGAAFSMAESVKVFTYATSLGHPTSLLFYYPYDLYVDAAPYYTAEHKKRIRKWVGEGLIHASIGLESTRDLIEDLDRALRARTFKGLVGPALYRLMKGKP